MDATIKTLDLNTIVYSYVSAHIRAIFSVDVISN